MPAAKAPSYQQIRAALGLPRLCVCREAFALPHSWYCRACRTVMLARRYALAVAVQRGRISLAAIPFRRHLSARFFKRRLKNTSKSGYLAILGRLRERQKRQWLEARGIPYHEWQSWLQLHRWHCVKPGIRRPDCWVCRKDELRPLPEGC